MPTMVFDEVDAGIGGRVPTSSATSSARPRRGGRCSASPTWRRSRRAPTTTCVVDKRVSRGATRTTVSALDGPARVEELARMLGGERITDATRRAARELYREARREGR